MTIQERAAKVIADLEAACTDLGPRPVGRMQAAIELIKEMLHILSTGVSDDH